MRTLRLRTRSLHACSIGKKTQQTEPAQQNNQILTLEGHDINNTVFFCGGCRRFLVKFLQNFFKISSKLGGKKKKTNKNRQTNNNVNNNAFRERILCHTWKGEIAHEMALLLAQL